MDILGSSLIGESADMSEFLGSDAYSLELLVMPDGPDELKIRGAIDLLYQELQQIDPGDEVAVAAYLESLPETLKTLKDNNFEVFVLSVGETGKNEGESRKHTYVFVTPASGYFRISSISVSNKLVHMFKSECEIAVASLGVHKTITVWPTLTAVVEDYRKPVPWCPTCCPKM